MIKEARRDLCRPENDLYRVLTGAGHSYPRYDTLEEALEEAPVSSGLLVLADAYPCPVDVLSQGSLDGRETLDRIAKEDGYTVYR